MGVLQRFEKRLENLVEGAFAKVFKGVVHPVEIASAMQREADAHKSILGGGRTLVPNRYIIDLSPSDHDRLAQYAATQARLITSDGRQFTIVIGSTVSGRGEGAQVRLADVGISRQHARVDFDGSRVVLTDLSSTNGTTVNGNRINAAALQHGDVVQLGTTSLTFRLDG